ncbi:MAG TPA: DUF1847 domain-containing protein [Dehalococcoidales bacterium]|nr:DUF1847 domain-containing protein [Dehalococcoidales bacterium]
MTLSDCAKCKPMVCRAGFRDGGPEKCPMHFDFPSAEQLYVNPEERTLARNAALVESRGYGRWTRVEETMEFAKTMGFSRIGVVSCNDMKNIADLFAAILQENGFEVINAGSEKGNCHPIAAAALCNNKQTQLNVLLGMHTGHDSLFIKNSSAWVTSLVVRDMVLVHNPVAALYGATGYFREKLNAKLVVNSSLTEDTSEHNLIEVAARLTETSSNSWSRVEEIIEFTRRLGVRRIGLLFCAGLANEANILTGILEKQFEVISIACKTGAVPKEFIGISDSEKVRPGKPEMMCNPLAQIELLNINNTGLNILMGQCVGHDSLSMRHSNAPVVCLVAKDRVLQHNTVAALYESCGYMKSRLAGHKIN